MAVTPAATWTVPLLTSVPLPKELELFNVSVAPLLTVVPAEKVFAPKSVKIPVPALFNEPVPEITPEKVVSTLPETVNVAPPKVMLPVVLPTTSAIEATVSLLPLRSHVALLAMLTAEVSAITPAAPFLKVPALIVVAPV